FSISDSKKSWGIFVYMSTNSVERAAWLQLESDVNHWGASWFIIGDWNDIISNSEKKGGNKRSDASLRGFKDFINRMAMMEVKMEGYKYTWCNNRSSEGLVEAKLDRGFGSIDWLADFPTASISNIARSGSDHSLLLLSSGVQKERVNSRFHFDKRWLSREGIKEVVNGAWSIKIFWQQKSKAKWIKEGDRNTKFFHALTLHRRRQNAITRLITNQQRVCSTHKEISDHISSFYDSLFSFEGSWGGEAILPLIPVSITAAMNQSLLKPVSEQEMQLALLSLSPEKSPGEDGMTALFYQSFWDIIKLDLTAAISSFFEGNGSLLKYWNHTILTLIPKCPNPEMLSQYRPISLCTVVYKILSKLIALRLQSCLDSCISHSQAAFLKGRQIFDNIFIGQEAFHFLNRHTSGKNHFMALKLDLMKAFDR
ncbi:DNAse I-like superfamily protein, partial [Striga hermonthica]